MQVKERNIYLLDAVVLKYFRAVEILSAYTAITDLLIDLKKKNNFYNRKCVFDEYPVVISNFLSLVSIKSQ